MYVGGSGPENYTKIQDAIDNASDGDTIYVFNGTYYENVVIDVSVNLIGEDKNRTIIDGGGNDTTIKITADGVFLNCFTINNSEGSSGGLEGIKITSDNDIISENNIIPHSMYGILLSDSSFNNITYNTIKNCYYGIYLFDSNNNTIAWNTILNPYVGSHLSNSRYNSITHNNIAGHIINCISLDESPYNRITFNNLISNLSFLIVPLTVFSTNSFNTWDGNYWDGRWERWFGHNIIVKTLPRPIYGQIKLVFFLKFPLLNFDWHQAKEPFYIPQVTSP